MASRQLVAYLVSVGLKSMAERGVTTPDDQAIAAIVAAGSSAPADAAEAIRQLLEMSV